MPNLRAKVSKYSFLFTLPLLVWFLIRVIPKPSRALYPCQRIILNTIVFNIKWLFLWLIAVSAAFSQHIFKSTSLRMAGVILMLGGLIISKDDSKVLYASGNIEYASSLAYRQIPSPQRIVRVHSDIATNWDFITNYYWQYVDQSIVDRIVEKGVAAFIGVATPESAWQHIMSSYNPGDKVGIKINGNDLWNANQAEINALPQVINAVIKGLKSIGVPESDIWVIEPTGESRRTFYQYYYNEINGLYPGVQLLDSNDISFGNHEDLRVSFPYTNDRYITDQMWDIDHLIIMPIMKAITPIWGVTGTIKMMQGNIENQSGLHGQLTRTSADNPNVLIYQNPHIIGKIRLIIGDGLFAAWTGIHFDGGWGGTDVLVPPNHRDDVPNRWLTFGNGAPNVLFFGIDPVAMDCVMYDHLLSERNAQDEVPGQSMAPFNEPQLIAGAAAGLGIREHVDSLGDYYQIEYMEIELSDDTIPPLISGITSLVEGDSAIISWTTDEPSYSQVEYGTSTAYGNLTHLSINLMTSHVHIINNLLADTVYHYRVKSWDESGNLAISPDTTFLTQGISITEEKQMRDKKFICPTLFYLTKDRQITFDNLTRNAELRIYNLSGELVKKVNGDYRIQWDGRDEYHREAVSGTCIVLYINDKGKKETKKLVIIK